MEKNKCIIMREKDGKIYPTINKSQCVGCQSCMQKCPLKCIKMISDCEGFSYPNVDLGQCIGCSVCEKSCPVNHVVDIELENTDVYACINKDKEILMASSSGGVFTSLATATLNDNGVVFAAMYDEDFNVIHDSIKNLNQIYKIQGSKYVQSNINNTFISVKRALQNDQKVLFSGTPCQIAGLKRFLNKDYSNLLTCDFICTGVPSPKIFNAYKTSFKHKYGDDIKEISFRNKKMGWNHFSFNIKIGDKTINKLRYFDPYIQGHYRHLTMRPACYNCKFKGLKSGSDIKLGDYWNVSMAHSNLSERRGVSVLMLNSCKGKDAFVEIQNQFIFEKSSIEAILKNNISFSENAPLNKDRKQFFEEINNAKSDIEIIEILKKYTDYSFWKKLNIYKNYKKNYIKTSLIEMINNDNWGE